MKHLYFPYRLFLILTLVPAFSCKKYLEVELDKARVETTEVFGSDITANSAIAGIYFQMLQYENFTSGSYYSPTIMGGLSADELRSYASEADKLALYANTVVNTSLDVSNFWNGGYRLIYSANLAMKGIAASEGMTAPARKQLDGEARFIRAFCHFYLVNFYGDVPLITGTDYVKNSMVGRTPVDEVYASIVNDLQMAYANLADEYTGGERVRINKAAAAAMLARVYLYRKEWDKAVSFATEVIGNTKNDYHLEHNPDSAFLLGTKEAIWQLRPVQPGYNTGEGMFLVLAGSPINNSFCTTAMTPELLNAYEPGDKRRVSWVGKFTDTTLTPAKDYYFPYKYKLNQGPVGEYSVVLRLAEVLLIRAEAQAMLHAIPEAQQDINQIRARAGLPNTTAADQASLLEAIKQERRVELACEWGHRWLDVKRWGIADAVFGPVKPGWNKEDVLYPIPLSEMKKDPNLKPQNPGY